MSILRRQPKPKFGDIYRVASSHVRPAGDDRRWMYLGINPRGGGGDWPITMMILGESFYGTITHWPNLDGFVRVEE